MVQKYDLVRHISTGRFGSTLLTKASGQLAVMKTIDVGRLRDGARAEVLVEVQELATLKHPHLVILRESFLEDGVLFIVTDYLEGGHLAGRIEKARASAVGISESQVLQWYAQAALALDYLHTKGALHRDFRARRLLLTSEGHVAVSGVAISALLAHSLVPEKPDIEAIRYLAPELVAGAAAHSRASDVWALGIVLYELLALQPPFDHTHPRRLAELILAGPLPPPPPPCCSLDVRGLCASLLRRGPSDRLSTSEALREPVVQARLQQLLDGEPVPLSKGPRSTGNDITRCGLGGANGLSSLRLLSPRAAEAAGPPRPMMNIAPLAVPRALRRAGELCSRKTGRELPCPRVIAPVCRRALQLPAGFAPTTASTIESATYSAVTPKSARKELCSLGPIGATNANMMADTFMTTTSGNIASFVATSLLEDRAPPQCQFDNPQFDQGN